jgi:hypothetical protein
MDSKNRGLGLDAMGENFLSHRNIQLGSRKGAGFKVG